MSESLPKIAQCAPYPMEVEADTLYSWCACGLSSKQPLCDGTHKGSGFKSLKFTPDESKKVWLCGCKQTKTPPYCDGSHLTLKNT